VQVAILTGLEPEVLVVEELKVEMLMQLTEQAEVAVAILEGVKGETELVVELLVTELKVVEQEVI
tara:strand:- start:355 stop:549 length:195 start_codon:yes stop_codon:yes gene_type:complete